MRNKKHLLGKTAVLLATLLVCLGMTAFAAPAVEGDTELEVSEGEVAGAEYTITADTDIEHVELTLLYDKDELTYMSGSGGNNYSGTGGNGMVLLTSNPGSDTASFSVKFRAQTDGVSQIEISSCVVTVDGQEIDVLTGETVEEPEEAAEGESDEEDEEEEDEENTASWVIDGRTFYLKRPGDIEDFSVDHIEIQGKRSRVLKHDDLDLYVIYLNSDNGSFRDYFVYNPDTGNVIPYYTVQCGTDTVTFLEPDKNVSVPVRYSYVDMPWGQKYSFPAYKHVIIDGIDELFDDTNRYLLYGMNQDGEKAWYDYDYDLNSVQKFDETMYNGEQAYITELEESVEGQKVEAEYLLERYNTGMGRRLTMILTLVVISVILLNVCVMQALRIRKMRYAQDEEPDEEPEDEEETTARNSYVTGSLEENETDFHEPSVQTDADLEIIDLDDDADEEE